MADIDESVYKLKEFGIWNDANSEARFGGVPVDLKTLMQNLKMKIIHVDEEEMEFDVMGIGPPIVNAIRRILIAEIPTMAIDNVHMYKNTTVLADEVLAHRLGLVPIKVDPRLFVQKDPNGDETEEDTLKFELKVKCTHKPNAPKDNSLPKESSCFNSKVYSKHLKFVPLGKQKDMYGDIRPVHEDILLNELNPGHEIDLEAFCYKNIGRTHAKFSPVVVASYRLMPQIKLLEEITGDRAYTLANIFPGVIKVSKKKDKEVAKIVNHRKLQANRNIFLHEDLKNSIEVSKKKEHYIFTVESAGALPPDVLVLEAINVLKDKCTNFLKELKSLKV